jgi:hypothetical protein
MVDKIYCGIKQTPKGKIRGSMIQCVKKKQVRLYGRYKIDPRIISLNISDPEETKMHLLLKLMEVKGKLKFIRREKHRKGYAEQYKIDLARETKAKKNILKKINKVDEAINLLKKSKPITESTKKEIKKDDTNEDKDPVPKDEKEKLMFDLIAIKGELRSLNKKLKNLADEMDDDDEIERITKIYKREISKLTKDKADAIKKIKQNSVKIKKKPVTKKKVTKKKPVTKKKLTIKERKANIKLAKESLAKVKSKIKKVTKKKPVTKKKVTKKKPVTKKKVTIKERKAKIKLAKESLAKVKLKIKKVTKKK